MPSSFTRLTYSLILLEPSNKLYSVCTCKCVNAIWEPSLLVFCSCIGLRCYVSLYFSVLLYMSLFYLLFIFLSFPRSRTFYILFTEKLLLFLLSFPTASQISQYLTSLFTNLGQQNSRLSSQTWGGYQTFHWQHWQYLCEYFIRKRWTIQPMTYVKSCTYVN